VAEGALHRDDVAPGRDQAGGVEVPQVVEADVWQLRRVAGRPPAPRDCVVVERVVSDGEQPPVGLAFADVSRDVFAEDGDQLVGQVDDPLRPYFGGRTA